MTGRCLAQLGLVYWCDYHDAEWPSGWKECRAVSPNASDDGRPAQVGPSRTDGASAYRREAAAPVVASVRKVAS